MVSDFLKRLFGGKAQIDPDVAFPVATSVPAVARRAPPAKVKPDPVHSAGQRIFDARDAQFSRLVLDGSADARINLAGCRNLKDLPENIFTGSLNLSGCTALERLPSGLNVAFLDLADCSALQALPEDLIIRGGRLNLRNCAGLTRLPDTLGEISQVDLSGCLNLTRLPDTLKATAWIDIGGTSIESLPPRMRDTGIRWRGVAVDHRIAFEPHTLTHAEILGERNAEVRRVMIERFGYERFMQESGAKIINQDRDAGGPRQLLRVEIDGDEPLVCVSVRCPSTGHHFFLRVPPNTRTCQEAVAWTAGFDDARDYRPVVET